MKTFDIAIVGCGNISEMHFSAYKPHPERLRLVAAFDPVAERVAAVQQKHGVAQGFDSLEAMIAGAEWEVAVVCTPTSVRQPTIEALAAAGKHVFVEKPFADNYAEAQQMVAAAERANVRVAVNQNFRYHYPFEWARQQIESGRIGKVVSIAHQDISFRQDAGWRTSMARHAMSVMGVHWFDGFRYILGSEASLLEAHTYSSPAIDCAGETDASVHLVFEDGTPVSYIQSFSSCFRRTDTIVIGETGALYLDYHGAALYDREHRAEPLERWDNPDAGSNKPQATFTGIDMLLRSLEDGTLPANSAQDNLKTIALLDAAYRSADEGRAIQFQAEATV